MTTRSGFVLGYSQEQIIDQLRGQFVETLFAGRYFWRDRHKHEVDLVLDTPVGLVPVEIKYQNRISPADTKNLLVFMEEYNVSTGILVTKDLFDKRIAGGREILYIPAWVALLTDSIPVSDPVHEG
jgi:predicted AAA+ superfamily ATPase